MLWFFPPLLIYFSFFFCPPPPPPLFFFGFVRKERTSNVFRQAAQSLNDFLFLYPKIIVPKLLNCAGFRGKCYVCKLAFLKLLAYSGSDHTVDIQDVLKSIKPFRTIKNVVCGVTK